MQELKGRRLRLQLVPQSPRAKVSLADVDVVNENHAASTQLRAPEVEVGGCRLVGVTAVDMQQIDASIGKMLDRFFEGRSNQPGECRKVAIVIGGPLREHAFIVEAGLRISPPRINGIGGGRES